MREAEKRLGWEVALVKFCDGCAWVKECFQSILFMLFNGLLMP